MAGLRLQEESRPPRYLVRTSEWMDISNVASLLTTMERIAPLTGITWVGLDLGSTEYIDSAAVSALIQCKSLLEDHHKTFALVHLGEQIQRVLEETRLISLFPLFPDETSFWAESSAQDPEA